MGIQWQALKIAAFTAIRLDWPVTKLEELALAEESPTPVSGDALIQRKQGRG